MRADPLKARARPETAFPALGLGVTPLAGALASVGATALLLLAASLVLVSTFDLDWTFASVVLVKFLSIGALVLWNIEAHPHRRFGPANVVTVLRGGMAVCIGSFVWEPDRLAGAGGETFLWALVVAALVALSLDGLDGMLARRTGLASPFGERLDMEIDAVLILVLCALVYVSGKAGAFVLAIGLMRYGFRLCAALEPRLKRPLAPSLRRKAVCVLQIVLLCVALLPPVDPPVSGALVMLALATLAWSFATDIVALLRRPA